MRIAFVCETLEPGRSGVGDYTWRLAAAMQAQGHEASVLAFSDRHLTTMTEGERSVSELLVPFRRVPSGWGARERAGAIVESLSEWQSDWTSLQFVPYSFHPKGWPAAGSFPFNSTSGGRHHLMVHETWIGQYPGAPLRTQLVGRIQKHLCLRAMRAWSAAVVHTSCDVYATTLAQAGASAAILPMFGTVEHAPARTGSALWERLRQDYQELASWPQERARLVGVFGSLHDLPGLIRALDLLTQDGSRRGLFLVVCLIGHSTQGANSVCQALRSHSDTAAAVMLGGGDDAMLSNMFHGLDMGVTTTPLDGIGKSSAAASLRDHGLPVLACTRGAFGGRTEPPFYFVDDFVQMGLLENPPRFEPRDRVHDVAAQLLRELEAEEMLRR